MSAHPLRRRAAAGFAVTAALAAALLTGTGATATVAEDASTPVPMPTPDGTVMSYVLNARIANPGQTHVLAKAVAEAEGAVVQAWPQIGVVVAHSTNGTFRADVAEAAGRALESVGLDAQRRRVRGHPRPTSRRPGATAPRATRRTRRSPRTATSAPRPPRRWPQTRASPSSGTCR